MVVLHSVEAERRVGRHRARRASPAADRGRQEEGRQSHARSRAARTDRQGRLFPPVLLRHQLWALRQRRMPRGANSVLLSASLTQLLTLCPPQVTYLIAGQCRRCYSCQSDNGFRWRKTFVRCFNCSRLVGHLAEDENVSRWRSLTFVTQAEPQTSGLVHRSAVR